MSSRVAIALGSNLGDRRGHLVWAIGQLSRHVSGLCASTIIETAPFDVAEPQPQYLNAAAVGETDLTPAALLEFLLTLERARGRERPSLRAPRTLDLDLILYGDLVLDTPHLVVPHPRFRERAFVLQPLLEVAADWKDPKTGLTIAALFNQLRT